MDHHQPPPDIVDLSLATTMGLIQLGEMRIGGTSPKTKPKTRKESVYYDSAPMERKGSVYFNSMDEDDVDAPDVNSLRAEVRAATEIAAVAKFHSEQARDETEQLKAQLEKQQEKFRSLEEVVHLLMKEVAHLSHDNTSEK
ncbi:hypothetical protein TeGR_g9048, partial [Tetraparma gracilis]